jgi:nitrogen regulatory protein PII
MKMYFLVFDVDFDDDVTAALDACCITGYTKWTRVLGKGERSDPKFDNAVWPGFNCSIMMAVDDVLETAVAETLERLHRQMGRKGLKVFTWPVAQIF